MAVFKFNSLRSRLMLLVALAIAPSGLMAIYTGWKESVNAIAAAQENLQRLTNLAAINEAQSINGARQLLMDLSDTSELLGGDEQCNALMRRVLEKNPGYVNLGLIQLNGDVTCSAIPFSAKINLKDRIHFKTAVAERRFVAGNYVFGRVVQKHTINLTYPVISENGDVQAVVFAALDLIDLDRYVEGINLPKGSIMITADTEGAIIARRPDPQQWFGHPVSAEMLSHMLSDNPAPVVLAGPDDVVRLHAFAHVGSKDTSSYTMTIGIPRSDIVAAARRDQAISLAMLAVTTLLALIATWIVGDVIIVRRVRKLVDTSQKIAAGDLHVRTNIKYTKEEIGVLAQALDEMAYALQRKNADRDAAEERLRDADQRKDQFLAMLAHELRNPLAPISSAAQLIRIAKFDDQERLLKASDIIIRQVAHMAGLVDDLIDVSRVTRGLVSTEKHPQDMKQVIADAVEQVQPLVRTRRLHLVVEADNADALVLGDQKRLVQIIANVLHNSAKYTHDGGNIALQLRVAGEMVVVTIEDDGIGMSSELLPRVFDLFTQGERTSDRSQGGLGIGLALVKRIVELHDGTVEASSGGADTGSKFVIRLPLFHPDHAEDAEPVRADMPSIDPLRILIVEDSIDAANSLAMVLESCGHQIAIEHSSIRGLERARIEKPDVCLLDIGLPDLDGYELARRMRVQSETKNTILIAVTGYDRSQLPIGAAEVFNYYLVKPIDTTELAVLLANIASQKT
jgi:signal transduction histidine kinase/ActR/RegA family two-component response regulator